MSTSVLKALPGKLDIKRHSPSFLYLSGATKIADTTGQADKSEDLTGAKVITTLKGSMGERITKALHKVEEKKKKRAERRSQVCLHIICFHPDHN